MTEHPPTKIVSIRFWREENGKEPVREWLKSLTKEQRRIIGEDLKTVEMGWPLSMPLVRGLGGGLWEVRSSFREGIARVIFKMFEGKMVYCMALLKRAKKQLLKI